MTLHRTIIAILVLLSISLQVRLWVGEGSLGHVSGLRQQVDQQLAENTRKESRNALLKAEILDLRNGLDAIEERARSELGLIRNGETFFLVL